MVPDFPHNIRLKMAQLNFFCCVLTLLCLCPVGCLSLAFLNWDSQLSSVRTQQQKISIGPILFLYYEESLLSSNLNSKLFRFHCVKLTIHTHPIKHTVSKFSIIFQIYMPYTIQKSLFLSLHEKSKIWLKNKLEIYMYRTI